MDFEEYTDTQLNDLFWKTDKRIRSKRKLIKQYPKDKGLKSSLEPLISLNKKILQEQGKRAVENV